MEEHLRNTLMIGFDKKLNDLERKQPDDQIIYSQIAHGILINDHQVLVRMVL